jgi:hypothetical protein
VRKRIYIDTCVIGGYFDAEFKAPTALFFEKVAAGRIVPVISELTEFELQGSPRRVRDFFDTLPGEKVEYVELTPEAYTLARKYVAEGVVRVTNLVDAEHIAIATVCRVDVLVSWNFKHIVNLSRIYGFNGVNMKLGYPLLEIRSPKEVIGDEG